MLEEDELTPKVRGVEDELQKTVIQDFILVGPIYEVDEISPRGHGGSLRTVVSPASSCSGGTDNSAHRN